MKQKLRILHGALGSKQQFDSLICKAKEYFDVFFYTFPGHVEKDFSSRYTIKSLKDEFSKLIQKTN